MVDQNETAFNKAFDIVKSYLQGSEAEKIAFLKLRFNCDSHTIYKTYHALVQCKVSVEKYADDEKHLAHLNNF